MNKRIKTKIKFLLIPILLAVCLTVPGIDASAAGRTVKRVKIINVKSGKILFVKKSVRLKVKTYPKVSLKRLEFVSSNKRIATVSKKGKITAKRPGTVYITVRSKDKKKKKARVKIRVYQPVQTVTISSNLLYPYMKKGVSMQLTAQVSPSTACQNVKWSSSNKNVATVSSTGKVTTKGMGRAVITATVADGSGKKALYTAHVMSLHSRAPDAIAHRGYSSKAPENTRAAFQLASSANFGAMECDVQMTEDGQFVISHDDSLSRIFGVSQCISESLFEDIQELKAVGGNGVDKYPNEQLLTLEQFMDIMVTNGKVAYIELKPVLSLEDTDRLYELISSYGINDRVAIISFEDRELLNIVQAMDNYRDKHPETVDPRIWYLSKTPEATDTALDEMTPVDWAIANGFGISLSWRTITPEIIEKMHTAGLPVTAWTVDAYNVACYLFEELGVDNVTSNKDLYVP